MRALLDANVIIALLDPDHVFHERAHAWWAGHDDAGWASCPVTENGVVRIMSNGRSGERGGVSPAGLMGQLATFARETEHRFWPDDVSLRDATIYTTFSPCLQCTKMTINADISEVVYNASYPLGETSLALLREAGVKVRQLARDE